MSAATVTLLSRISLLLNAVVIVWSVALTIRTSRRWRRLFREVEADRREVERQLVVAMRIRLAAEHGMDDRALWSELLNRGAVGGMTS